MKFKPEEVMLSPTLDCNLNCPHCDIEKSKRVLSKALAAKFLRDCKRNGIKRVGFTGGEPFLASNLLYNLVKTAVKEDMLFGRIMTNAVWFKSKRELERRLQGLYDAGYDGDICVSVDALHSQNLEKVALFMKSAAKIWRRPDIISIAYVTGYKDRETSAKIKRLLRLVDKSLFVKTFEIGLTPVERLRIDPWGDKWFKEDYCKGPGDVFFVLPDGTVKPCCGYATGNKELTIGNIRCDSVRQLLENTERNRFVSTVFSSGLGAIRKRLERRGVRFPGKTANHCYFCNYILRNIPRNLLQKCL